MEIRHILPSRSLPCRSDKYYQLGCYLGDQTHYQVGHYLGDQTNITMYVITLEIRQRAASSMLMLSFADVSYQWMKPLFLQNSAIRFEFSGVLTWAWSHCKN